ncbi:hypothetical protein SO802_022508 [Lithocarpus litseifolius]|uniref:NADP-dependent oxidoreductase domain-containing protein n=1 Tax=Lithocarpus litseifolius TaxID=425828 RepID=A0AAW2C976_9ROSI
MHYDIATILREIRKGLSWQSLNPIFLLQPHLRMNISFIDMINHLVKTCVHTKILLQPGLLGYRHFDTANIYGSKPAVRNASRKAILDKTIEREDFFVTSKLWGSDHHDPVSALKQTLQNLGMEYLDMYLVHWPVKLKPWACDSVPKEDFEKLDLESTWAGMEKCMEMRLCRCIGVSNFSSKKIERLLDFASVTPAVNQVY